MANLNKQTIPVAVGKKSHLDLSHIHITSMDFGQLQPVMYRHMIKGETIDVDAIATVRLAPLYLPVYGKCTLNLRSFFVPFRQVFPNFDAFYLDTFASNYGNSSLVLKSPYVKNSTLANAIINASNVIAGWSPGTPYDFINGTNHYSYGPNARKYVKFLKCLGYVINLDAKDDEELSILPILAYLKIFVDWYANSQFLDSYSVLRIKEILSFNNPTTAFELQLADVPYILDFLTVNYDTDNYFISAWSNPAAPNPNLFSSFQIKDATHTNPDNYYVNVLANGTAQMERLYNTGLSLGTQFLHDALQKANNFMKRNQLSGSYEIDRWLSRYGQATQYQQITRSIYVSSEKIDIQIGDVTNMSGATGSTLGDYAGKGYAKGNKHTQFTAEEFGIFVTLASIVPSAGFVQGLDRNNLHILKNDFFNEEYDGLSVQAVNKREVYISNDPANFAPLASAYNDPYGYVGRYGEYKRPLSNLSGDLASPTAMAGGDAWHLLRLFDDASFNNSVANLKVSLGIAKMLDGYTYDRIFNYQLNDFDHFYCFFDFKVGSYAPCRPLFETYDFDGDESHKEITLNSNGAKLN